MAWDTCIKVEVNSKFNVSFDRPPHPVKRGSVLPVEILPIQDSVVLRARGSELLILPQHVRALKDLTKPKDFSQYFRDEALLNRPARKLFEAWLRKDQTLWPRLYTLIHKEMDLSAVSKDGKDNDSKPEKAGKAKEKEVAKPAEAEKTKEAEKPAKKEVKAAEKAPEKTVNKKVEKKTEVAAPAKPAKPAPKAAKTPTKKKEEKPAKTTVKAKPAAKAKAKKTTATKTTKKKG
jgi:hypothetical protein